MYSSKVKRGETNGKKEAGESVRAATTTHPLNVPTLDAKHYHMLRGKRDQVPGLNSISVEFFQSGLIDVTYNVEADGESLTLTASQFNAYIQRVEKMKVVEKDNADAEARGYARKMYNRGLIMVPDEWTNGEMRQLQGGDFPKSLKALMGRSQAELAALKLNTAQAILSHWAKMPKSVAVQMDSFQEGLTPGGETWSARVDRLVKDETQAAKKRREKELRRQKKDEDNDDEDELISAIQGKEKDAPPQPILKSGNGSAVKANAKKNPPKEEVEESEDGKDGSEGEEDPKKDAQ